MTADPFECIKVLEPDEFDGFLRGNALKYLCRAGKKGDAVEDMDKARWYLDRLIQHRRRNP